MISVLIILMPALFAAYLYDRDKKNLKKGETEGQDDDSFHNTILFLFALLMVILGLFDWAIKEDKTSIKEQKTNENYEQIDSIEGKVDTVLLKIDTVGQIIVSVDTSLERYFGDVIQNLNVIKKDVDKSIIQVGEYLREQKKFLELSKADLNFYSGGLNWVKVDSQNTALKILFKNTGGRNAENIKFEVFVLTTNDTAENIIIDFFVNEPIRSYSKSDNDLTPYQFNKQSRFHFLPNILSEEFEHINQAIIHIRYSYKDSYYKKEVIGTKSFIYTKNSLNEKFRDGNERVNKIKDLYFKIKKLKYKF